MVKPCYYEPQIHDTYQELADHYGTAILPTRTHAPKDKAKVENAVLHAERRILARLRDQTFFSLGAINTAIRQCLKELNERPGWLAPRAIQRAGPTRPAAAAAPPLPVGRMATSQGQHRLPCAGGLALLLRALSAHAATDRGAAGRAHRRAVFTTADASPPTGAVGSKVASPPIRRIDPRRTRSIWTGRRGASSTGRARWVRSAPRP